MLPMGSLCENPPLMFLTIPPTPRKSNVNLSDPPKHKPRFWDNLLGSSTLWNWPRLFWFPFRLPNMEVFPFAREFMNPRRWWWSFSMPSPLLSLPKVARLFDRICLSVSAPFVEELPIPLSREEPLVVVVEPIWAAFWSNAVADIWGDMFSCCTDEFPKSDDKPDPSWLLTGLLVL